MPLESISLRKLLKIGFATPNRRRAELRGIIRQDRAKAAGAADEGGDFYAGFWADARAHVFGTQDLHESTAERVASNRNRQRLYPLLRDGFLRWWSTYRRRTNEPFQLGPSQRTRFEIPGLASMRTSRWLFAQLRQGRTLRERHATRRWRGRLSGRRPLGMATWSQRKSPESAMCSHPTGEVWLSRSSGAGSTVVRKCATASAM